MSTLSRDKAVVCKFNRLPASSLEEKITQALRQMRPGFKQGQMINISDRLNFLPPFLFNSRNTVHAVFLEGEDINYTRKLCEIMEEGIR